ncbi:MAG: polysaccharide biosynthesis/export family protein [Planctomycetes bacterium]|nr:polysaccharide biosynthesis/export family protein [Planctomycetota bacterium]
MKTPILLISLALCLATFCGQARGDPYTQAIRDSFDKDTMVVSTDPFASAMCMDTTARDYSRGYEAEESYSATISNSSAGRQQPLLLEDLPTEEMPAYRIRTGDAMLISIPYEPDSEKTVPVRPDGRINYLFDIEVMAAGLTYAELNQVLCSPDNLGKYYKNPRVTIIGRSFGGNSVFVMGPVARPGKHEIHNDTYLLDVLSVCGAMSLLPQATEFGERQEDIINLEDAYIARKKPGGDLMILQNIDFAKLLVERDMSHNIKLMPGDFIYLPSSLSTEKKIFMVGQLRSPQVIYYSKSISFVEAIAEAGGVEDGTAWVRKCFIIRGGVKQPKEMLQVNYPEILACRADDITLQNGDIILIPKTPLFKTSEVISSVLLPLRNILELDDIVKNRFHGGDRTWKEAAKDTAKLFKP